MEKTDTEKEELLIKANEFIVKINEIDIDTSSQSASIKIKIISRHFEKIISLLTIDGLDDGAVEKIRAILTNISPYITNYLASRSTSNLDNAESIVYSNNNILNSLIDLYSNYPLDVKNSYDYINFSNAIKVINENMKSFKESNDQEKSKLKDSIKTLEDEKIKLVKDVALLLQSKTDDIDSYISNSNKMMNQKIEEIESVLDVAKRGVHSENYIRSSKRYRNSNIAWTVIGSILVLLSAFLYYLLLVSENFSITSNIYVNMSAKFLLTSPVLSVGIYALRRAGKYDKLSIKLGFIGNDLSSLDSFIKDTNNAEYIKEQMAYKYYGNIHEETADDTKGLFITPEMLLSLSPSQFESLKTLINALNGKSDSTSKK